MLQGIVIKRFFYVVGIFYILNFLNSTVAAELWEVNPSKYYAEYAKANAEYMKRTQEKPNMTAEEKKQLQSEVFAKANTVFQEENLALSKRIDEVMKGAMQKQNWENKSGAPSAGEKDRKLASSEAPSKTKKTSADQRNITTGGGNVKSGGAEPISFK